MRTMTPLTLLLLTGCPKPPTPVKVDPAKVVALSLVTPDGRMTFCPHGEGVQIAAQATLDDGKIVQTRAAGEGVAGRLEVSAFEWTTSWGQVDADARLALPYDPIGAIDREVTISARLVDRPDLVAQVTLAPQFGCGGLAGGYGIGGSTGSWGDGGQNGQPGQAGQEGDDERDGQDGDDGGHGGDAGDAGDGSDGGPGPYVEAMLTQVETERHGPLVALAIPQTGELYLIDPDGEPFWIVAIGGRGGDGGSGGAGGRGGDGGKGGDGGDGVHQDDGTTSQGGDGGRGGSGGDGGNGGNGGRGGEGGDGGELRVIVDPRWPELGERVGLSTSAGEGGSGGNAGYGGSGGNAGSGGYGGSGGGSTGSSGSSGNSGTEGSGGPGGRAGRDGAPPRVQVGDVTAAFRALETAGIWTAK